MTEERIEEGGKPMPRSRRSNGQRSAETRLALTEAVIKSLCELGYARTTVQEISKRSGITSGAMQHHFGSKDDLVAAALDKLFAEVRDRLEAFVSSQTSPASRVRSIVRELWAAYYGHPRYMAVWEIVVGSRSDKALYENVRLHRQKSLKTLEGIWRRTFDLVDGPSIRELDAMHFALSFMRGSILLGEVDADADFVDRQLALLESVLVQILGSGAGARVKRHIRRA